MTFDSCAALSHPIAHIQCGPVCWGSAEEVSVIITACTTFCTSLPPHPTPHPHLSPLPPPSQRPPKPHSRHCSSQQQRTSGCLKAIILKSTAEHCIITTLRFYIHPLLMMANSFFNSRSHCPLPLLNQWACLVRAPGQVVSFLLSVLILAQETIYPIRTAALLNLTFILIKQCRY